MIGKKREVPLLTSNKGFNFICGKKRGMLVVVVILLVLLTVNVFAAQYVSIGWKGDEVGGAGPEPENSCDENRVELLEYFAAVTTGPNLPEDNDCKLSAIPRLKLPPSQSGMAKGCWFVVMEDDDGADNDDGGWAIQPVGQVFDSTPRVPDKTNSGDDDTDWMVNSCDGTDDAWDCLLGYSYYSSQALLCSDDELWYSCDSAAVDTTTWVNGKLYECTYDNYIYSWVELGLDQDQDGWGTKENENDCKDEPLSNEPSICSEIAFEQDDPKLKGLTLDGIRAEMRNRCDGKVKYSECSACINPGAAEMCGDGSDNDCEPQTSDNCHENQASCEQREVGYCDGDTELSCYDSSDCAEEDAGECTFVQEGEDAYGICSISGETCSLNSDEKLCGDDGGNCNSIQSMAYNIYKEEFSWIDAKGSGGYCCGYNGVSDTGTIAQNEYSESFVCLNKNVISTEKSFAPKSIGIDEIFENSNCKGNWCWLNSADTNNQFKVITIKKPDQQAYDVVSNNDQWLACNATVSEAQKTFKAGPVSNTELKEKSNRFYCYPEGDRWSWAECVNKWDDRANPSIKGRYTGEGLYTLPLSIIQSPQEVPENPAKVKPGEENDYIRETLEGPTVTVTYDNLYKKYYGKGFLDFSGYTHLNLMVRFVDKENNPAKAEDLKFPLAVNITIVGPKEGEVIYLQRNILGDVINTPFVGVNNEEATEGFMQVKIPIGEYKAVRAITLTANAGNRIQVRNFYLTSDKPGASNLLCSGQGAQDENSWLKDADAGNRDAEISGENLCTTLYGKKAWLGLDDEVAATQPAANCCGNAENEYYAGLSKGIVDLAVGSKAAYYGCWNSQPLASGDTIMDIQFNVSYVETSYQVTYEDVSLPAVGEIIYTSNLEEAGNNFCPVITAEDCDAIIGCVKTDCDGQYNPGGKCSVVLEGADDQVHSCNFPLPEDGIVKGSIPCSNEEIKLSVGETFKKLCEFKIYDLGIDLETAEFGFKDVGNDLVEVLFYDLVTQEDVGKSVSTWLDKNENPIISGPSIQISKGKVKSFYNHPVAVIARLKKNVYFPATVKSEQTEKVEVINYSCSKTECLFPLPGTPKYKVTNLHHDLYELYYVTGTGEDTLITQPHQEFDKYANLRVKRIAQQVLYYNEGKESTKDIGFYGCRAADYISHIDDGKNLQYCAVVGDAFCSFSEVHEENNKDGFTIINTWSKEGITHVGYDTKSLKQPEEGQNISAYYESTELVLRKEAKSASLRNQSTSVLPARNFISNAEFTTSATKLPYWEILVNNEAVKDEKTGFVKFGENKVILGSNQKLRSERISVPSSVDLHFSTAQECTAKIILVDKDGNSQEATLPQFNTGDASYVIVEFTGPCEVEKPSLQLVDELGPAEYAYQSHPELANPDARSGAACCPNNYCWNGYSCVEPMSILTTISEHIADGRDYRCIDGQWKKSALKFDWNNQQWGFCPQENECFVLGSGKAEHTAQTFYNGQYPICINNNEYVFDNYCNQGNWTSRTKFLATKLLEVAENDEYVLYCSPYREALLEWGNNDNKLGGTITVTEKKLDSLPENLGKLQVPKTLSTCYPNLDKRLVPDEQNTCINNVCILQYKDGGVFKAAFATTLNKDITDPNSFLLALNIPDEKLSQVCQGPGKDFIECNLQGLKFPSNADLYHSDKLNALIFARDGIQLEPGVVDKIVKWFKNLFGSGLLAEKTFVTQAQNFRNIYIANVDGKKVRAVEEIYPGVKQTLVAEYQNFDTPVCEYVKNIKVPLPELEVELLEKASGIEKVHCAMNDTVQKVVINAGLDFFWPQLTGKLRIGESS